MKCRELPAEEMFSDSMKRRNDCIMNNCYEDNFTSGIELNPMLITKNQGLLEVHIVRLQLSKTVNFKINLIPRSFVTMKFFSLNKHNNYFNLGNKTSSSR